MLPAAARLTHRDDFTAVLRRGRRAGRPRLVVHLLTTSEAEPAARSRAGLVVSKAVGNAVVRHRVARRLRHLLPARLDTLPPGSRLVVRALPLAAQATSTQLDADLTTGLRTALARGSAVTACWATS